MPRLSEAHREAPLRVRPGRLRGPGEVSLAGELDLAGVTALEQRLDDLARSCEPGDLVVSLRDVTFIDSSALRVFIRLHQRLEGERRHLVLRRPRPAARRLIQLNCGDDYLRVEECD